MTDHLARNSDRSYWLTSCSLTTALAKEREGIAARLLWDKFRFWSRSSSSCSPIAVKIATAWCSVRETCTEKDWQRHKGSKPFEYLDFEYWTPSVQSRSFNKHTQCVFVFKKLRAIKQQWCQLLDCTWETTTSSMLVRAFARRHGHTDDMFVPVRSSLLSVGSFRSTLKKSNSLDVSIKDNHYHHCIVVSTRGPSLSPLWLWPWRASPSLWHLWLLCFASRRCLL